jgi:hypothetical protein
MTRRLTAVALVVLAGCGGEPTSEQVDLPEGTEEIKEWADDGGLEGLKAKVARLREELMEDTGPVAAKAMEGIREAAAGWYSEELAEKAKITIAEDGIRAYGDTSWEVTGEYVGEDEEGRKFSASWNAELDIMMGSLDCVGCGLEARTYLDE